MSSVTIRHIFISPGHNFFGHHGMPPDQHSMVEQDRIRCIAGRGIAEDRFLDYKEDYKGQITFFDWAVFERMRRDLSVPDCPPSAMRRNVLIEGIDLNSLIGRRFTLQGVAFEGIQECTPCYWMNNAVGDGAENYLRGHGGLRARILSDGALKRGHAELSIVGTNHHAQHT